MTPLLKTAGYALQQGIAAHKEGNIQEADRLYTAILGTQPKHPDANHNKGVLMASTGQMKEALHLFKNALEANSGVVQFWKSYIDTLIKLNRHEEAKAVLTKAKNLGAHGEGLEELERWLELKTLAVINKPSIGENYPPKHKNLTLDKALRLAKMKAKEGSLIEAQVIYQKILSKFPKNKKAIESLKKLSNLISKICKEYNIWLHVDAAMAGAAALCPEFRYLQEGLEYANSYTFNPHKWMLTNFDCSVLFIDDRDKITSAMSVIPEYLKNKGSESGEVIDYMDWSIPLGRKFRGLKLWQVINYYGIEGLQEYIREHVDNTQQLKTWIEEDNNFEIVAPVPLNLICFKHKKGSDFNRRLHEAINQTGKLYITKTKINNEYILRFSIGQATGTIDHIRKSWKLIQKIAENID